MTADPWPMIGRDDAWESISQLWRAPGSQNVVVSGPPGVGRTRLAAEIVAGARRAGHDTRWAVATAAVAAFPLGALVHLAPEVDDGPTPGALLRRTVAALSEQSRRRRLVVVVDDAHLLDELSLALIHQLAVTATASVVLTLRADRHVPEPLACLSKDGWASHLELEPLDRAGVAELTGAMLGGLVDAQTTEKIWRTSRGHPLFVRELVDGGRASGLLAERDGMWEWDGPLATSQRLRDVVRAQWGPLDAGERDALELIAVDEPAGLDHLSGLVGADVVTALERRGLIVVDAEAGRWVRLAHPVYTSVVRAAIPESHVPTLRRRLLGAAGGLASVAEGAGRGSDGDLVRAARLRLDGRAPVHDPSLFAIAAAHANDAFDHELAERLGRAAVDHGGGVDARLALVEALRWQGLPSTVREIGAVGTTEARSAEQSAQVAVAHALDCFFLDTDPATTDMLLRRAEGELTAHSAGLRLRAVRGMLSYFSGRPAEAAHLGREVLARGDADAVALAWAAAAVSVASASAGRNEEALQAAAAGRRHLALVPLAAERAFARLVLGHGEFMALCQSGRLHRADEHVAALHEQSLAEPGSVGDAVMALYVGWSALVAGRPRTALRWLSGSAAGMSRSDPTGSRRLCLAQLALARALVGEARDTSASLREGGTNPCPATCIFEPHVVLADAWKAAADGRRDVAVDAARRAAALAAESGQWAAESRALHGLVRFGAPSLAVDRLRELASIVDGPFVVACADHAAAAAVADGGRLEVVSDRFVEMGAELVGADAAAAAADAHRRQGDPRRAVAAATRATTLVERCEGARTPAVAGLQVPSLTIREREVATLAAQDLSNQAIAARLVRSVRTVEAHLARAYTKLGVHTRAELDGALGAGSRSVP